MDERAINGAAIEAIRDLELDCEIKDVCRSGDGDEWCVEFSGKFGQLCDEFKNQFGEENSPQVIREKIKAHLIKQVSKIRGSTGRKRRSAAAESSERREPESGVLTEPLKVVGEVLSRASGLAGEVIKQASAVAETARATLAAADLGSLTPVSVEVRSTGRETQTEAPASPKKRTGRTTLAPATKTKKAAKHAARRADKQPKKASAPARKTTGRTQKKAAKKSSRRNSRRRSE